MIVREAIDLILRKRQEVMTQEECKSLLVILCKLVLYLLSELERQPISTVQAICMCGRCRGILAMPVGEEGECNCGSSTDLG